MIKKFILLFSLVAILFISFYYNEEIVSFVVRTIGNIKTTSTTLENNSYASSKNYEFIQLTDNFSPKNKKDLMNIYYTILNSGMKEFTFYCSSEYKDCLSDINDLSDNQTLLSSINNYVPVYNTFKNIDTQFDTLGKVTIQITPIYTKEQQEEINQVIDQVIAAKIKDTMTNEEKIKVIHDYIINETKYDKKRADNKVKEFQSDTAYGALIEHKAICGGYSDAMKLFLERLGIENYKISSENHIWNLVRINNQWLHLDLTWDDPITETEEDILEYDYFLITTKELLELETEQHNFDQTIFKEAVMK